MATADSVAAPRSAGGDASPDRAPFLAYINDDESESTLRMGLSDHLDSIAVRRGGVRAAIRALERERTPRVLVVDLSDEDDPVGALDTLAGVCEPDVTVLAIGNQGNIEFYREITRGLGVAEYLTKPLTRDNVARLFGARVAGLSERPSQRAGHVVAVCGVRGGVAPRLDLVAGPRERGAVRPEHDGAHRHLASRRRRPRLRQRAPERVHAATLPARARRG